MAKKIRRIFAMCLALCLFVTVLPVNALAAGTTETATETSTEGGITTTVETTTTTTTDEDGKTTVIITVNTSKTGTDENGAEVSYQETASTTTQYDRNDNLIGLEETVNGSESKEWDEDVAAGAEGQPEVTVGLIPGGTASNSGSETTSDPVTTTETDENGKETTTTTTTTTVIDRVVDATASEGQIVIDIQGTSSLVPLIPDRTIDDDGDLKDEQLLPEYTYSGGFEDTVPVAAPDGYDYRFTGFGQMSIYGAAIESGRTGALQFQLEYDPFFDPNSEDNKVITENDIFLAYCADINTGGIDNYWYRIDALEDAGYYDEEAATHIRAVALNGYWGTSNEPDENGEYQLGSLAKLKEDMKAAVEAGLLTGITAEEIDSLTEGQALNATQSAIWMYANETTPGSKVDTDRIIAKGYAANKAERVEPSEEDRRNAIAVFNYLMGLEPMEKPDYSEVIDEDAFIAEDSMSITVGDKLADIAENEDEDDTNDIYDVSLNFALVVTPDQDKDDLIVQVVGIDENGNPYIIAQGRIAGGNAEEDKQNNFHNVSYDAEAGIYTLEDLTMAENSDFSFDLKLVGTQYLEHGVYVFTSETRNGVSSQTFVSIAEGSKEVNVSQGYTICFNVDEEAHVSIETEWNSEYDPEIEIPEEDPVIPGGEEEEEDEELPPAPVFEVNVDGGDAVVILDEEVPLADAPKTGSDAIIWVALAILAALGMAAARFTNKKRQHETF